nr:MAG TPA: hypothetical protein [Caudoviricetes sp.]
MRHILLSVFAMEYSDLTWTNEGVGYPPPPGVLRRPGA